MWRDQSVKCPSSGTFPGISLVSSACDTIIIFGGFMISQTLARLHFGKVKGWRFHEWHLYAAVAIMIGNFILKNILLLGFHISL